MNKHLQFLLVMLFVLFIHQSFAQVTLVSNNTNLQTGFVLPNGKPLLEDSTGYFWTTDGTTATNIINTVIDDGDGGALYKNQYYFSGYNTTTNDVELWATDGTAAGTKLIKNVSATGSSTPEDFFILNNLLYFTADDSIHGRELWVSDGTAGSGSLVADINSGAASAFEESQGDFQNGNTVYFQAISGQDTGVWKIDAGGAPALVKNFSGTIYLSPFIGCAALGSKVVFTVQSGDIFAGTDKTQLWSTEGTSANTILLKDFGDGSGFIFPQLTPFNNLLYFDGSNYSIFGSSANIELWTTDGTPDNTKLFKDFGSVDNASLFSLGLINSAVFNNLLFFSALTTNEGAELWTTDGTPGNTKIVKDINPGNKDASPAFLVNVAAYASLINLTNFSYQQLYSTAFKGKLYFTADDGTHGSELWSTDGTSAGTQLLKDINLNKGDGVDANNDAAFYTSTGIYFVGDDGNTGAEPWFTDGTANGTNLVADVNPAAKKGSDPQYSFLYNSQIYFIADNGDSPGGQTDLYKINQTVVLPVRLLTFTVALQPDAVAVGWATATEINTNHFVVERSTDASYFTAIGTVAAAGSASNHTYQFSDVSALQTGATTLYYRLKIIDNDGKYTYSATLPVHFKGGVFTLTLSPNPVRNQLTVVFSTGDAKSIVLRITDANGKPVYQQNYQAAGASARQQTINAARFTGGTYFVQLITDKQTKTTKFIKQ